MNTRWTLTLVGGLLALSTAATSGQATPSASLSAAFDPTYVQALTVTYHSHVLGGQHLIADPSSTLQNADGPKSGSMLGGAALASGGSIAGLFAGVFAGAMLGGGTNFLSEDVIDMAIGAAIGSWLGAAGGSMAAGGHIGKSLGASAVGMVFAAVLVDSMHEGFGTELAFFTVAHGLTTAVFSF